MLRSVFIPPLTDCCRVESHYKEGKAICLKCGLCVGDAPFEIGSDVYSRAYIRKKRKYTKYKRVTRLREVIKSLQGEGQADLPDEIVPFLKSRVLRYPTSHNFDHQWVRQQLKREKKFKKYSESSVRLCRIIFPDYKPPLGSVETADIEQLFDKVSHAFDEVRTSLEKEVRYRRLTFLHYGFALWKILELLGRYTDAKIVRSNTSLQTPELLALQEFLWAQICEKLGVPIIPTIGSSYVSSNLLPFALHSLKPGCPPQKEKPIPTEAKKKVEKVRPVPKEARLPIRKKLRKGRKSSGQKKKPSIAAGSLLCHGKQYQQNVLK